MRASITLSAAHAELTRLQAFADEFAHECGLPDDERSRLLVILDELFTNAVTHGHGPHSAGARYHRGARWRTSRLRISFVDDGPPFDPLAFGAPDLDAAGEERPIGGLGIHIVRSLVDQARYRREGGRNHLHLIRHIAPAAGNGAAMNCAAPLRAEAGDASLRWLIMLKNADLRPNFPIRRPTAAFRVAHGVTSIFSLALRADFRGKHDPPCVRPRYRPSRTTGLLRVPMPVISISTVSPCLRFSGRAFGPHPHDVAGLEGQVLRHPADEGGGSKKHVVGLEADLLCSVDTDPGLGRIEIKIGLDPRTHRLEGVGVLGAPQGAVVGLPGAFAHVVADRPAENA